MHEPYRAAMTPNVDEGHTLAETRPTLTSAMIQEFTEDIATIARL